MIHHRNSYPVAHWIQIVLSPCEHMGWASLLGNNWVILLTVVQQLPVKHRIQIQCVRKGSLPLGEGIVGFHSFTGFPSTFIVSLPLRVP
jgi:hypothetical protein